MKNGKKSGAPESYIAGNVGFVQKRSVPKVVFGMLCRFIVALTGASGVCLMFDNAFGFIGAYEPLTVIFTCLIFCAAWLVFFVASDINIGLFSAVATAYISVFAVAVFRFGPEKAFGYVPLSLWNTLLARLDSLGFTALSGLKIPVAECDPATPVGAYYAKVGFFAFCAIISFVFISCLYKKVRAVPVIVTAGIVMTVTFTYNLLSENLGFLLTVSSAAGMIVLLSYSAFTKQKAEQKKIDSESARSFGNRRKGLISASSPGFAALIATALVFAVAAYPASRITEPAPEFTVLYGIIDEARDFFSSYLTGDSGGIDDGSEAEKKSTEPTPRKFTQKKVMTVTAKTSSPIYMRAWISEAYGNDKWKTASNATDGVDILPEEITELFYTIVDVDANILADTDRADSSCLDRGFVKEFVTVKSEKLSGNAGYLASRFSKTYGIKEADAEEDYKGGYTFRPGVGTVELSMKKATYGTVAYTPNYRRIKPSKLDGDMKIYDLVLPYIKEYIDARLDGSAFTGEELELVKEEINEKAAKMSVEIPSGCLINYIADMSDTDLSALKEKIGQAQKYENHVYENCVSVPWSDEKTLGSAAAAAFGGTVGELPSDVFSAATRTADYLANVCDYTLTPEGYTDRGSYVAQFLTTTKNGYCVQYATAGALMLRTAGIPTRYVDGYLASEFTVKNGRYVCPLLDSDAHAWVEVYIRGYGWMTFEMTEPMLDGLYNAYGSEGEGTDTGLADPDETRDIPETTRKIEPRDPVTRPLITETEPEPIGTLPGEPSGGQDMATKAFAFAVKLLVVVLIASTVVFIFMKIMSAKAKKREDYFIRMASGGSRDPEKDMERIRSYMFFLFDKIDVKRGESELMADFAVRVNRMLGGKMSFVPAARALQKDSFGHCADKNDCKDAAEYVIFLRQYTSKKLTGTRKLWYCKVRKLI